MRRIPWILLTIAALAAPPAAYADPPISVYGAGSGGGGGGGTSNITQWGGVAVSLSNGLGAPAVGGAVAAGQPVANDTYPILVSGIDGSNNKSSWSVLSGIGQVAVTNSPTISGTVALSQITPGTTNAVSLGYWGTHAITLDGNNLPEWSPVGFFQTDNTAFTAGTTGGSPINCLAQSSITSNPLTAGRQGTVQCSIYRAIYIDPIDSGGTDMTDASNHALKTVNPTTNPSSVLTRPADTTAYAQNDLIASSTTAGSVVVPSFTGPVLSAGSITMIGARLLTNKTSGWSAATFHVEFWSAAPTFTNGDNGAYAVATGAATWLGACTVSLFTQVADGAYGACVPDALNVLAIKLGSGQSIFWSLQLTNAAGETPASGQTFTIIPELLQGD